MKLLLDAHIWLWSLIEPEAWVRTALSKAPMKEASINSEVALLSRKTRLPHQDPADRFIAATASVFGLTLSKRRGDAHEIMRFSPSMVETHNFMGVPFVSPARSSTALLYIHLLRPET